MGVIENILDYQVNHGVFESASFPGTKGIARLALEKGFDNLSYNQKNVLSPYLSKNVQE